MLRRRHRSLDLSSVREERHERYREEINDDTRVHTLNQTLQWRTRIRTPQYLLGAPNNISTSRHLQEEVTHPAPMTTLQIKRAIETRPETNQDVKFLDKKKCAVCLSSWKEILLAELCLVFTHCGHVFCRPCAMRIASENRKECAVCKRSLAFVTPPFRRLHLPLDPQLNKK